MSDYKEFDGIDSALTQLPREDLEKIRKIIYGKETHTIDVSDECKELAFKYNIELVTCGFNCKEEQLRSPKLIRVAAFQHKLVPFPTSTPIQEMKYALFKFANKAIRIAARGGANIFCFPELWNMPYAFCTREKNPWCEYAESAKTGPTTKMLQELAKIHNMVIISPILERDDIYNDTLWNTAVIIDNHGEYLGKYRKNHISRNAYLNESIYYTEGNAGHPVFETEFGNIAVCLGSYYPLSWLMFGLNGADIVFNPSAVAGETSEPLWGVAARNAAIANSYFTCAVNRAGTEVFVNDFTTGDGKPPHRESDYFFGSSYITAPNGTRSPGLSRTSNGLLIAEMDLNLCRQIKDQWGLQMTQRLEMYAKLLSKAAQVNFVPQRIRKSQD
ncbi:beta-ureidopropionase-like [Anoplophora glabripennis]|uniref:beta-ureidopropionase-like n=1 Tax=Anoplophora glabripennis TaxID=217634 RepID=UPI000873C359|nr:beta-ureidopropionase-like [Anoplophora glabripennis]